MDRQETNRSRLGYSLIMAEPFSGHGPEINLVAIHTDQQQILVDQNSATIRLPRVSIPHPFAVHGQTIKARFAGIIESSFGLKGQVLALSAGMRGDANSGLFVVFYVRDAMASSELDRKGFRWRELTALQELLDPGTSTHLQNAVNLVRAYQIADNLKDAWSIGRARLLRLLRERMAEKDGLIGWTQFLSGVLSSAIANVR